MTTFLTEEQLAALEQLEHEATFMLDREATFIIAARNALEPLITEVRMLRSLVRACASAGCPTVTSRCVDGRGPAEPVCDNTWCRFCRG